MWLADPIMLCLDILRQKISIFVLSEVRVNYIIVRLPSDNYMGIDMKIHIGHKTCTLVHLQRGNMNIDRTNHNRLPQTTYRPFPIF